MHIEQGRPGPFYLEKNDIQDNCLRIVDNKVGWSLCNLAEERLQASINDGGIILINERLLVKFNGKLTALCIENFTSEYGDNFIKGYWYSPLDKGSKKVIRNSFDEGFTKLEMTEGEWLEMRQALPAGKLLVHKAKLLIDSLGLTNTKLISEEERISYRVKKAESENANPSA